MDDEIRYICPSKIKKNNEIVFGLDFKELVIVAAGIGVGIFIRHVMMSFKVSPVIGLVVVILSGGIPYTAVSKNEYNISFFKLIQEIFKFKNSQREFYYKRGVSRNVIKEKKEKTRNKGNK